MYKEKRAYLPTIWLVSSLLPCSSKCMHPNPEKTTQTTDSTHDAPTNEGLTYN